MREDPPYLTHGADVVAVLLLMLGGLIGTALGYLDGGLAVASIPAYLGAAIVCRYVRRRHLRRVTDDVLNKLQIMRVVRPIRATGRR